MECQWIPAAELPHTTALYSAYLNDFQRVSEYYLHPPNFDGISQAAGEVRLDNGVRKAVVEVLREQNRAFSSDKTDKTDKMDESIERNLDRLRDGASAVVTGQQVGLFGGPAYSVYKALTAIHVAKELTARGINAVPVFWLATEDHDLAEVDHCFFAARSGLERSGLERPGLERFDLTVPGAGSRRVGEIPLGEAVRELAARAAGTLDGTAADQVAKWIEECYRPEETFGSAFAKLLTRVFAGSGLILLDPLAPELHRQAATTLIGALREHEPLARELAARSAALEQAGYHAQVKVSDEGSLLFRIVDGQRLPLRRKNGGFAAGGIHQSFEETLREVELHPDQFSPSALLRPVVQDALLPTVAYVGGPAEIAYHAQTSVVYKKLLGRAPAILPRSSFTVVTAHVANLLRKYNLEVKDVFAGRARVRARLEAEVLPENLTKLFADGDAELQKLLEKLRDPLTRLDKSLVGALDTVTEKMIYQFNNLRTKAGRAEGFRTGVLDTHEREIIGSLLPEGALQERSVSPLSFLATQGMELLDELDRHIRMGTGEHCVIYL